MESKLHGRGTARCTTWAPPTAYVKKEVGEPGVNAARCSLDGRRSNAQFSDWVFDLSPSRELETYDDLRADSLRKRRSAGGIGLRLGSLNVGTMVRKSGEVIEMVGRRGLDFCCLQETKWKGQSARTLEGDGHKYKFFWTGCKEGSSGVGILVAEKWLEKVVEVKRINERLMLVRLTVGVRVVNIVSAYAPQAGRPYAEKEEFWLSMTKLLSGVGVEESVFVCGDMNGHVGCDPAGFESEHGGNGFGKRNTEGEILLEFAMAMELIVCNTFYTKDESKKITYESGDSKSEIDYILVRRKERSVVRDVTTISGEACATQHKLLLCKIELSQS